MQQTQNILVQRNVLFNVYYYWNVKLTTTKQKLFNASRQNSPVKGTNFVPSANGYLTEKEKKKQEKKQC